MLDIKNCCLVIIDVQGKLAQIMHDRDNLFKRIVILIKAAKILDIPIVWCQQVPEALGATIPQIAELLAGIEPINKAFFSCCGEEKFNVALQKLDRKQIILCGIETHVCVYQTASDLLRKGYETSVIADAVSSRTLENKQIALERMRDDGVHINCVEMALFELLGTAEHPQFKQIAALIK
jgi:nicotinamidase-related amidase